jgi:hypothetical protein
MDEVFDIDALQLSSRAGYINSYLCYKLKIDYTIVKRLLGSLYLFQESVFYTDKHTGQSKELVNALFPIYNDRAQIVGAEAMGTLAKHYYNELKPHSMAGYGYSLNFGYPAQTVLFFTDAVELLCYMTLQKIKRKHLVNCKLVSLAGLQESIFTSTIKVFDSKTKVLLCVNQDVAGQGFARKMTAHYPLCEVRTPDKRFNSWHEQLFWTKEPLRYAG